MNKLMDMILFDDHVQHDKSHCNDVANECRN